MAEREDIALPGSKIGGKKAAETNIERYGKDFYKVQGRRGGQVKGIKKGFTTETAKKWGQKGGQASRRTGIKNKVTS